MSSDDIDDKRATWRMFDGIARRYDRLNAILSLGRHGAWRRRLVSRLPEGTIDGVLDLATGTADVLLEVARARPDAGRLVGVDLSEAMLSVGRRKLRRLGLEARILLRHGDAAAIPFADASFDAVTMAFGIRNVPDPVCVLMEMFRVLRPGGRALILEFALPENGSWRAVVRGYLRVMLPVGGRVFSRDPEAYRYLLRSIETFPRPRRFRRMIRQTGFVSVDSTDVFAGLVTLFTARKPEEPSA